jgi:pimeloyl-ACP methyl ester carboxylesterase
MQLANLYNFNREEGFNTANYKYFRQALLEMHNASNKNLFVNIDQLDGQLEQEAQNIVPIGILNTDFQLLNYNMDNETLGGLLYNEDTKRFSQINGRPPFYTLHTTVIAPLKKAVEGNNVTYKLNINYLFQNQQQKIKTLSADFGDGVNRTLITNQQLISQNITVPYATSGVKTATYQVTYEDNSSLTTYSTLYFKKTQGLQKSIGLLCAGTQGLGTTKNDTLQADISFQGYNNDPSDPNRDPTIKAKIQYRTYFADNNSTGIVNNPIIILDGFDPGDKRKIEDCDCENDADCISGNMDSDNNFDSINYDSIVDLQDFTLSNGDDGNALETLRTEGFDVIIVNHPTYKTDDLNTPEVILDEVEIDGGAYYIESNAFALVKLLQETRDLLAANGSDKKIKLIGPSMGGQIAKYALSYMEKQEQDTGNSAVWDHNVSHYVSFDSPHLGANIPLGDQALLYLLSGESAAAKEFYEEELASPASRQQLIEFHQPKMVDVLGMQVPSNSQVQQSLLNARTISQGFSQNHGDDFFKYTITTNSTMGFQVPMVFL